jgi:thiol-disulfide isomerase/thioredoxin
MRVFLQNFLVAVILLLTTALHGALPNGSDAPNFTITDLNGNVHTLYDYLDQGKPVILNFSATWCPPCWNYHQQQTLKNFYNTYGPPGSDQVMVFHIEADFNTNTACLYGLPSCQGGTQGDWVTGVPYPIFDLTAANGPNVRSNYQITYYPTIYIISPDRRTWEVGAAQPSILQRWIFESFTLEVDVTAENSYCGDNGSATANNTGGWGNKTYQWTNGGNSQTITGLASGEYGVRVTDGAGYFIESEVDVDGSLSGMNLFVNLTDSDDVLCNGGNDGRLEVDAGGGNYGYQYAWSNGSTSHEALNLYAGTHTVTVTDAQNCTAVNQYSITEPGPLVAYGQSSSATCDNDNGSVTLSGLGGVGPYEFNIGPGYTSESYFEDLSPGNYIFSVRDAHFCEFESSFDIEIVGIPVAMANTNEMLDCETTQITVSGAGSSTGSNISYLWTTEDGNIVGDDDAIEITVNQSGTYNLMVTNTQYDCVRMASVDVEATTDVPSAVVGGGNLLNCLIRTATINGTGSSTGEEFEYSWSVEGDGQILTGENELEIEIEGTGIYTLTVINIENGCENTASIEINEDIALPSGTVEDAILTCDVESVELCVHTDETNTVIWLIGNNQDEGNCFEVNQANTYTARIIGENGCENTAEAQVIADEGLPVVALESSGSFDCLTSEIRIDAGIDIENAIIEWSSEDGLIIEGQGTESIIVGRSAAYTISVLNPENGCNTIQTILVDDNSVFAEADFSYSMLNGILTLRNTSNVDEGVISWEIGDDINLEGNEANINLEETGTYTICLTVENECGSDTYCEEILYVSLFQFEHEKFDLRCFGDNDGRISVNPSGGLPEYSISWEGLPEFEGVFDLMNLEPGIYTMILTDNAGNERIESFEVQTPDALELVDVVVSDCNCFGSNDGFIGFEIIGGTGGVEINWEEFEGEDAENLTAGTYSSIIIDENGCVLETSFTINQPEEIVVMNVEISDTPQGESLGGISIDLDGGVGEFTVIWSNGMEGFEVTNLEQGVYFATVTDENSCEKVFGPFEIMGISSTTDLDFVRVFSLYPNPSVDYVNYEIEFDGYRDLNVTIRDFTGKMIFTKKYAGNSVYDRIDVTGIPGGIYFLEFRSGQKFRTEKLFVIK